MSDGSDENQSTKPTCVEENEAASTCFKSCSYSSNPVNSWSDKDAREKIKKEIDSSCDFSPPNVIPAVRHIQSKSQTTESPPSSAGNSSSTPGTGSSSGTTTTASPGTIGSSSHTSTPSSGETNSSADTVPASSPEENQPPPDNCWGIFTPMQTGFLPIKLVKDEKYIFGRSRNVHYSFNLPSIAKTKYYSTFSKLHFAISRSVTKDGKTEQVFIQDLGGNNGTFINGVKVTRNSKVILPNRSRIAIANQCNDILLFEGKNTVKEYPEEINNKFVISKQLGYGACSRVMEAWEKNSLKKFAIKIINKDTPLVPLQKDWMMEANILRKLKHPCIIGIHDVIDVDKSLFIVLEYAPGKDLFARVHRGRMTEATAKLLFCQMVKAVQYLHANGITHRDLKPENILLMSDDEQCLIKITDFGWSCLVSEKSFMKTLAGTPTYVAPEVIRSFNDTGPSGYTKQVDMWSLGVILFVCLVSYPPFTNTDRDKNDIYRKIVTGSFVFDKKRWSGISEKAKALVRLLLTQDPKQRLTADEAIGNSWFNDAKAMKQVSELMISSSFDESTSSFTKATKSMESLKRNIAQSQAFSLSQKSIDKENKDGPPVSKYAKL